ncbi:MAG: ABC transporter permease [Holophagales bacterium]|nr:ABC transporter permease [Holophagales bacterium]
MNVLFDLRRACRSLLKRPGFSTLVIATMAVGIGANLAVFGYLSYFLWPKVEAPRTEDLVWMFSATPEAADGWASYPDLRDMMAQNAVFEQVGGARIFGTAVHRADGSRHGWGFAVTGDYFALLGARPSLGRLIEPDDDRPGAERVVVLNHHYWQRHFAADPSVVGSTVELDGGQVHTIIGVTAKGFQGTALAGSLYVPIASSGDLVSDLEDREAGWISAIARLRPDIDRRAAETSLAPISRGLDDAFPRRHPREWRLVPVDDYNWNDAASSEAVGARMLMAAVGLLLVLACANIANLMLARATARRRELGILAALGADRWRLATQLMAESLLLATAGGVLGILLGRRFLKVIEGYLLHTTPIGLGEWAYGSSIVTRTSSMAIFFAAVTLACALLFGMAPILRTFRRDLVSALATDLGAERRGRRPGLKEWLVVAQVALSLVLLTSAGLLARSLWSAKARDPGFEARGLHLATLHNPTRGDDVAARSIYRDLLNEARRLPGVRKASLVYSLPLSSYNRPATARSASGEILEIKTNIVADGYFDTLGTPWLQGRDFDSRDRHDSAGAVIVNRAAAEQYWPDQDPLGQPLSLLRSDGSEQRFEVVGVVAGYRDRNLLRAPEPTVYFTLHQRFASRLTLISRTSAPLEGPLHDLLRSRFPDLAIIETAPFSEQIRRVLGSQHMHVDLAGSFGALGLLLAGLGIFSVLSYSISRRGREIGLRMAIGADRRAVVRMVLAETGRLVLGGLLLGVVAALGLSRLLRSMLYGVASHDPSTFVTVVAILSLTALLAAFLPARHACRIEPTQALRSE